LFGLVTLFRITSKGSMRAVGSLTLLVLVVAVGYSAWPRAPAASASSIPPAASTFMVRITDAPGYAIQPLQDVVIYNVGTSCMAFLTKRDPEKIIGEQDLPVNISQVLNPRTGSALITTLTEETPARKPFSECALYDPDTGHIVDQRSYANAHHIEIASVDDILVAIAYSLSPDCQQFYVTNGIEYGVPLGGTSGWHAYAPPRDAIRECCSDALISSLRRYVEYRRRRP
jgi:hypothetical protein